MMYKCMRVCWESGPWVQAKPKWQCRLVISGIGTDLSLSLRPICPISRRWDDFGLVLGTTSTCFVQFAMR